MKRYVVSERPSGIRIGLCDTIGEALSLVARAIDSGKLATIMDAQGSGHIMVNQFDLMEAEGYAGRGIGSEKIHRPIPMEEIIELIESRLPSSSARTNRRTKPADLFVLGPKPTITSWTISP